MKWGQELPPKPAAGKFRHGVRFMIKLSTDCADDKPRIREMAGTSNAMLNGIAPVAEQYMKEKDLPANKGKLPVIRLVRTFPVKTGTGQQQSTNYHPVFEIIGWAPRGDLKPVPAAGANRDVTTTNGSGAAPSTGSSRAEAPQQQTKKVETNLADDFG